jgi:diguanylate cyclase (GGDEF)-like protein
VSTWTVSADASLHASLESAHPMDSSRLLLGLIALADQAHDEQSDETLDRLIPRDVARRLLSALHHRDASIVRHSRRVAVISTGIARSLGWDQTQLVRLEMAALLHDLGKIGIPDQILLKPGRFSVEEADTAAVFHRVAVNVLQACGADDTLLQMVGQLHTHFNRATEESLLSGGEVHQGARILAVADAYDALTNDRPHRPAFSHSEGMKHLMEQSGSRFDGNIVTGLTRWFETEGHSQLITDSADSHADTERPSLEEETVREAFFFANMFIYLQLLETTYDAFYVYDHKGRCRVWNQGAERLFNLSAAQQLTTQWSAGQMCLCSEADRRPLTNEEAPLMNVLRSGKPSLTSLKIQRETDVYDDIEIQTLPLLTFEGEVKGVLEIVRDLSSDNSRPHEYRDLKLKMTRDPLTSLANRGHLENQLQEINDASQAGDDSHSVIFLDVDHFKKINDEHGHAVGDEVLVGLAKFLQHETYSGEVVGRYGGEEFILICPGTDLDQAYGRAERLRTSLAGTRIGGLDITASFGVAEFKKNEPHSELLDRADQALYRAKELGRNMTCYDGDLDPETATVIRQNQNESNSDVIGPDELEFVTVLQTCVAANIIVYKLSGFVDELDAKIISADEDGCVMRFGSGVLLGGELPVQMELRFGREIETLRGTHRAASRNIELKVRITPTGWGRNQERFDGRCKGLMRELRSFLLTDD